MRMMQGMSGRGPMLAGVGLAVLLPVMAVPAVAASFDCVKAATDVERMICTDPALGALDGELAAAYGAALVAAGADDARLTDDQRAWLARRDRCADADCVAAAYRARLLALAGGEAQALGAPQVTETADRVEVRQSGPNADIEAAYPRVAGAGSGAANAAIAARVEALMDEFRGEYRDFLAENGGVHVGPPWSLAIDYEPVYAAPGFWSLGLGLYHYTGGAHGGEERYALVLSRPSGEPVPPGGLFRNGSDWLTMLSDYCYRDLAAREVFEPDDDWLRRGTAPEPDNYKALLPRAEGLEVDFAQYQVGPYSIGSFDVLVPYATLAPVLNPALFGENPGGD